MLHELRYQPISNSRDIWKVLLTSPILHTLLISPPACHHYFLEATRFDYGAHASDQLLGLIGPSLS